MNRTLMILAFFVLVAVDTRAHTCRCFLRGNSGMDCNWYLYVVAASAYSLVG
ncbi:MAG TPA: hypothetical protein VMW38_27465 [Terriglobia bacterium]|nr:hypothetical protein [Terriglobia bacterium]